MIRAIPGLGDHLAGLCSASAGTIRLSPANEEDVATACVHDLLEWATGLDSRYKCQRLWELMRVEHPDLQSHVSSYKFKRCRIPTPAADVEGVVAIIEKLPGDASEAQRESAAHLVLQHMRAETSHAKVPACAEEGEPRSLASPASPRRQPAGVNREYGPCDYQLQLRAGDSAEAAPLAAQSSSITPLSCQMQELTQAFSMAVAIGSTSQERLKRKMQKVLDDFLVPGDETVEDFVDAAAILRERAYTEPQIQKLASALGKDLKLVAEWEGREEQGSEQSFGADALGIRKQVCLYHRVRDAKLIEDVLDAFKQRPLYIKTMRAAEDGVKSERQRLLELRGQGRANASSSSCAYNGPHSASPQRPRDAA